MTSPLPRDEQSVEVTERWSHHVARAVVSYHAPEGRAKGDNGLGTAPCEGGTNAFGLTGYPRSTLDDDASEPGP